MDKDQAAAPKQLEMGATIGIIGGGQLGRMMAIAAARLGLKTIVLEPQENCPASQLANDNIQAAYDDAVALEQLSQRCDVITYEFENIDVDGAKKLSEKTPLFPPAEALRISQDRLVEKDFLSQSGLNTAPYYDVTSADDLRDALEKTGNRGILKTRRFGYDGKGQIRFSGNASDPTPEAAIEALKSAPAILEGMVDFTCEISVIATRAQNGQIACYEPAENVHKNGILFSSTVPASVNERVRQAAIEEASKLIESLNYVGTLGLEFFVMKDGSLIANEYAPRVHNSGHWTEAACTISQFEMHIRAISGWPLVPPHRHSDCVMENLLGDEIDRLPALANDPAIFLHSYGKAEAREGRKMGHFTHLTDKKAS